MGREARKLFRKEISPEEVNQRSAWKWEAFSYYKCGVAGKAAQEPELTKD